MKCLHLVETYCYCFKESSTQRAALEVFICRLSSPKVYYCQLWKQILRLIVSLVPLPKIDELYAMLNGSTVYYSLDCTLGYCDIALSLEVQ